MKTQKWQGWGQVPAPKFGIGEGVMFVVDEPDPDWPKTKKQWRNHWCLGLIIGAGLGTFDGPISKALSGGWVYQLLIIKDDGGGFFSIWDEPTLIWMNENELGRSTRARSLITVGDGQGVADSKCQWGKCSWFKSLPPTARVRYTNPNVLG
jgi:hypothetical protein